MFDIKAILQSWLEDWIPRKGRKGVYNPRLETPFLANRMDVDQLRDILAAAEMGNTRDLFAFYRDVMISDTHIQCEWGKRKLAVLGDAISIQPADKTKPADVQAQKVIQDLIVTQKRMIIHGCNHLLNGHLWPVSLLEKVFCPSVRPGLRYELERLNIVPYQDLDYTTSTIGSLRLWKLDPDGGYITGTAEDPDLNRYIIHRGHLLTDVADFWGGPFRALLFWWLMGAMDRDWWARFLERYGSPFIVGKYDPSDDAARKILTRAFQAATKIFGLVISKETQVELVQASSQQTGEAFDKFLERCNDEKSKLILGQTSSATKGSSGINSGENKQHESVRQDIRQYDQQVLALTLEEQLFRQYLDINGYTGSVQMTWGGVSSQEQTALGELMRNLAAAGLGLTDDGITSLSERLAFPLQRVTPPASSRNAGPPTFSVRPYLPLAAPAVVEAGHLSIDRIASNGAADLSQAFRGSLAPIRRIVIESRSANECSARVAAYYADWNPERLAPLIEEALMAFAANGAASRSA